MSEYNGWKNWDTWNVNLWITNEEHSYLYCKNKSADFIRNFIVGNVVMTDGANLDLVDWNAIAEGLNEQEV